MPGRAPHHHRVGALRRAVLADARGQDRPAPLRRAHAQLRRGAGPPGVLRGRPDGPHDPAHALRAVRQEQGHVLRRVPGPRPDPPGRHAGRGLGLRGVRDPDRRGPHVPQHHHVLRDGRLRPRLQDDLERARGHRRRLRARAPTWLPAGGHGVHPVPPDGLVPPRHPHHRGRPRRGRHPAQLRGRAVHGALRADGQGPRAARHGLAVHLQGDPRGPRRQRQGSRRAGHDGRREGRAGAQAARDLDLQPRLPRHRPGEAADPRRADVPLRDGRHPDQHRRAGGQVV